MSFTYEKTFTPDGDELDPIAKVINPDTRTSKLIYLDVYAKSKPIDTFPESVKDNDFLTSKNGSLNPKLQRLIFLCIQCGLYSDKLRELAPVQYDKVKERKENITNEINLPLPEFMDIQVPTKPERMIISGRTGLGKSTIASRYVFNYLKKFPKRRVVIFSRHSDDPAYEGIPKKRKVFINVNNPELLDMNIKCETLRDSVVVLDDCDALDKDYDLYMRAILKDMCNNGRKFNIHCLYLSHIIMDGHRSKNILTEADRAVLFLDGVSRQNRIFLDVYVSMSREEITEFQELNSRWALVTISGTRYVLSEHGIYLLKNRKIKPT